MKSVGTVYPTKETGTNKGKCLMAPEISQPVWQNTFHIDGTLAVISCGCGHTEMFAFITASIVYCCHLVEILCCWVSFLLNYSVFDLLHMTYPWVTDATHLIASCSTETAFHQLWGYLWQVLLGIPFPLSLSVTASWCLVRSVVVHWLYFPLEQA